MKNNIKFIIYILIVFLGIFLLGCPSTDDAGSGSNNTTVDPINFSFTNEYKRAHAYYAEVSASNLSADTEVTFLVSSSATAPALSSVSQDAYYVRKFNTGALKTRKIYIGWTDQYSHAGAKATRAGTDGTYGTSDDKDDFVITNTNKDEKYADIPWIMKVNTQYYLHLYYTKEGSAKTFTRGFTTLNYPKDTTEADALWDTPTNATDADKKLFDRILNNATFERKVGEPFLFNTLFYGYDNSLNSLNVSSGGMGGCLKPPNPTCVTGIKDIILINFGDHDYATGTFVIGDAIYFHFYDAGVNTPVTSFTFSHDSVSNKVYNITTITE